MMKKILLILLTTFGIYTSDVYAQDLEEWFWSTRNISFVAMDDMEIVLNESEEFEAHNDYISMFYKVVDFGNKSKKDMMDLLLEVAEDVGLPHDVDPNFISNQNLDGMYIVGKDKDRPFIIFTLGNKPKNSLVIGIIAYEASWYNTAIEMVRSIYME